jgi:hypothetical protein
MPSMTLVTTDFDITDLNSEILVDQHCCAILKEFHQQLLQDGIEPLQAGTLAHGADYFLRDFIISDRQINILHVDHKHIRQFAGHWFITKNLEPNIKELSAILQGVALFYTLMHAQELLAQETKQQIVQATADLEFYQQRIDQFWDISGDGYSLWCANCPL